MSNKEYVKYLWEVLNKYKETAEQHEFPKLMTVDIMFGPAYNDLQKNWDEKHAELFIKGMKMVFEKFNIEFDEQ